MAGDEPVTSPDQHRRTISPRLARFGAVVSALALIAMALWGNHEGNMANIFLFGIAALLLLAPFVDFLLRRNGLKSD